MQFMFWQITRTMPQRNPSKFSRNQNVRLKSDPQQWGPVSGDPIFSEGQWFYRVFLDRHNKPILAESDLIPFVEDIQVDDHAGFLRHLVLYKIRTPLANNVYSLRASRTRFEPYQFKPVLKFLNNPDQRLLIADEVGLGKTIEAGIIMLELQARLEHLERVLVVCPSALRIKWQDELRSRFDEVFTLLDTSGMRQFLDENRRGTTRPLKAIVSLETLRREEFATAIAQDRVTFDLVIIDEAHHCRNTTSLANNLASVLSDNAHAMLLLTATPLALGNDDFFNLLQILSPGEFDNAAAFEQTLLPNQHLNSASRLLLQDKNHDALAALRRVESTLQRARFVGNPYYQDLLALLQRTPLSHLEKVEAQQMLLELNTLSHIFTRTRKRDVHVGLAQRDAHLLLVEFTPLERQFYNQVIALVRSQFAAANRRGWGATFATIMRERQAASCISAMREKLELELAQVYELTKEDEFLAQELGDADSDDVSLHDNQTRSLVGIANQLTTVDSKFDRFWYGLREVLAENSKSKVLVFSYFKGTLEYLNRRLTKLGLGVRMMHGGIEVARRQAIVEEFRDNPQVNVLLSSEVGAEGLDFQFSDTLFNYDLPWNPMRVEQRIGRLDRFGQTAPKIRIYNLVIADSVEERIYYRLYERIKIFEQSIGDLEVILGDALQELSRKVFSGQLTPDQERKLADQTALAIETRKISQEQLDAKRHELMGQDQIIEANLNRAIESGRFVSELEIRTLVESFIRARFANTKLRPNTGDPTFALDCGLDLYQHMRDFILDNHTQDQTSMEFLSRCQQGKLLPLTYSADIAYQRKLVEFVTLRHPLARAAAAYWNAALKPDLPLSALIFRTKQVPAGTFYFVVFAYVTKGIQSETTLAAIVVSAETGKFADSLSRDFLRLVQDSAVLKSGSGDDFDNSVFEHVRHIAEALAVQRVAQIKTDALRRNEGLVAARRAAIEQTYIIKKRKLNQYLQNAHNQNIRRMRDAQLRNHEAWHTKARNNLDQQGNVTVSVEPIAGGMVKVIE